MRSKSGYKSWFIKNMLWVTLLLLVILKVFLFTFQFNAPPIGDEREYLDALNIITLKGSSPFTLYSDSAQPAFTFYPTIVISQALSISFLLAHRIVALLFGIGILCLMALFLRRFNALVAAISLTILGVNPALTHFSLIGWFNIRLVFFVLLAFLVFDKAVAAKKKVWPIFFALLISFIFQGYLLGRVVALGLSMLYFIALRRRVERGIFVASLFLFVVPFILAMFSNASLASNRITTVTLGYSEIFTPLFLVNQVFPTIAGLLGIPYMTLASGYDHRVYAPATLGILPIYFTPFFLIGLRKLGGSFILSSKNVFSYSQAFWILIAFVVVGVNMVTLDPLNVSRSLLIIPLQTILIAHGLDVLSHWSVFKNRRLYHFLSIALLVLCILTINIYMQWFYEDFLSIFPKDDFEEFGIK